ncbi:HIT-type domain-containing protein [Balamuthia mandrillaris]
MKRHWKQVDLAGLPALQELDPEELKTYTKDELASYLDSQGIIPKISKPEMKRQLRTVIKALRENKLHLIDEVRQQAMESHYSREQTPNKAKRACVPQTPQTPASPYNDGTICVGVGCRKKANKECSFQRCRRCCTSAGLLCHQHVNDVVRRGHESVLYHNSPIVKAGANLAALPLAKKGRASFDSPSASTTSASSEHFASLPFDLTSPFIAPPSTSSSSSSSVPSLFPPLPSSTDLLSPFTSLSGFATSQSSTSSFATTPALDNYLPSSSSSSSISYIAGVNGGRSEEEEEEEEQYDSISQICPHCSERVSSVGSNFLIHLRDCSPQHFSDLLRAAPVNTSLFSTSPLSPSSSSADASLDATDGISPVATAKVHAFERYCDNSSYLNDIFSTSPAPQPSSSASSLSSTFGSSVVSEISSSASGSSPLSSTSSSSSPPSSSSSLSSTKGSVAAQQQLVTRQTTTTTNHNRLQAIQQLNARLSKLVGPTTPALTAENSIKGADSMYAFSKVMERLSNCTSLEEAEQCKRTFVEKNNEACSMSDPISDEVEESMLLQQHSTFRIARVGLPSHQELCPPSPAHLHSL